jgi:hypothetical protein
MSAFYVVAYASLSLPAVLAGILVTPLGLRTTFEVFGAAVRRARAWRRVRGVADATAASGSAEDSGRGGGSQKPDNQSAPYGT